MDAAGVRQQLSTRSPGLLVQAVRGESLRSAAMAEMLVRQTLEAASNGTLLAKTPEMDLLLRIAGTTQIARAIDKVGARAGEKNVLIVAGRGSAEALDGHPAAGRLKPLPAGRLGPRELTRVESAALLNVERG